MTAQRIELVRIGAGIDSLGGLKTGAWTARIRAAARAHALLLLLVAAPTLAGFVYFFGFAADRYASEVKFVVRSPATSVSSEISNLVQGSPVVRSSDDAYIVKSFIESRDAMRYLVDHAGLMEAFEPSGADVFWRYPPFPFQASLDRLYRHYLRFVSVTYDRSTGVTTLKVQAFRPGDAQRLATALVARSEAFINGLSQRSGEDAVDSALAEVKAAEKRAHAALDAVTSFRNRMRMIDPSQATMATFNTIASLSLTTAETNATLNNIEKETPGGPQVAALKRKIEALSDQINVERGRLAGGSDSLAPQVAAYEELILNQTFAEQAFVSALATLESARVDARRQRVFIEPITTANLPDYPAYPYRLAWTAGILAISFMIWRVVRTCVDDTLAHARR